jgi:NADH:ubiquinone oxidoreductase subunit K
MNKLKEFFKPTMKYSINEITMAMLVFGLILGGMYLSSIITIWQQSRGTVISMTDIVISIVGAIVGVAITIIALRKIKKTGIKAND